MNRIRTSVLAVALAASAGPGAAADTLEAQGRIAAGGASGVGYVSFRVSPDGTIEETRSPSAGLTSQSVDAIATAPLWIRGDLLDLLARLTPVEQTLIATTILGVDEPRILDEVAYALAYLSPEQIRVSSLYLGLVVENARRVYEMDPLLDYVALVEEGEAGVDEDWWTTAEYVVMEDGVETVTRLSREVYYEAVVHPVLQDERLARIVPATGATDPSGAFWGSYAWQDDTLRSYERPFYLDDPVRIDDTDLAAMDFGGPAAGSVLVGPDRSYSTVIRDSGSGSPVLLEFAGQGGGCCSDSAPNPSGQVFATTIALERAWAAGDADLLEALLAAGPGNLPLRPDLLGSSDRTDRVDMRILVVRDRNPYGLTSDPVEEALLDLAIAPVDVIDSAGFAALDLVTAEAPIMPSTYVKIVVPSDQPIDLYSVLASRAADIGEYVGYGGSFELHGDSTEDWTSLAMPLGIDAEPFDGTHEATGLEIKGYPLLADVAAGSTYLWDRTRVVLPGERAFDGSEGAVARAGWWVAQNLPWNVEEMSRLRRVPFGSLERSVEPVRILHNHYGNCGEIQDLLGAALRTLLVPAMLAGTPLDDHVWNEFHEGGEWHPLQVDWSGSVTQIDNWGVAYDADTGGGKAIKSMISWRGDGLVENVLGRYAVTEDGDGHIDGDYSRYVTLRPTVVDADGAPVDGARIRVVTHFLYDPSGWYVGTWGVTGPDGTVDITVGEGNDYRIAVESPLGTIPASGSMLSWVSAGEAVAGSVFARTLAYDGATGPLARIPSWQVTEDPLDPVPEDLTLSVDVRAGHELTYGTNEFIGTSYHDPVGDALLDVLVVDGPNYDLLEAGAAFRAAAVYASVSEVAAELPLAASGPDLYVVVASPGRVVNTREVSVRIDTFPPLAEEIEPEPEASDAAADEDGEGGAGARGGCGCALVS